MRVGNHAGKGQRIALVLHDDTTRRRHLEIERRHENISAILFLRRFFPPSHGTECEIFFKNTHTVPGISDCQHDFISVCQSVEDRSRENQTPLDARVDMIRAEDQLDMLESRRKHTRTLASCTEKGCPNDRGTDPTGPCQRSPNGNHNTHVVVVRKPTRGRGQTVAQTYVVRDEKTRNV